MKKLIIILLLLGYTGQAQNAVGLAVYQDAKLAFFDDDYGNEAFTLDISCKLKLQAENIVVSAKFEYADLSEQDLYRYGLETGYCFRSIFDAPFDRLGIMPFVGYGKLWRSNDYVRTSWEFGNEFTFRVFPNVKIAYQLVWTQRPELGLIRFNHNAGLQFDIDTDYKKKQVRKGTRF